MVLSRITRIPPLALCLWVYHQYCALSSIFSWTSQLTAILVLLVSATRPPTETQTVILSPDGIKRNFVTHGGLFSKDGITLDEIRKINRIGRSSAKDRRFDVYVFVLVRDSARFTGEVCASNSSPLEVEY
jgi:hypothetical protein